MEKLIKSIFVIAIMMTMLTGCISFGSGNVKKPEDVQMPQQASVKTNPLMEGILNSEIVGYKGISKEKPVVEPEIIKPIQEKDIEESLPEKKVAVAKEPVVKEKANLVKKIKPDVQQQEVNQLVKKQVQQNSADVEFKQFIINKVAGLKDKVEGQEKYSKENRNRIGENTHLIKRVNPKIDTSGLTGYNIGQIKLSKIQIDWINKNIVKRYFSKEIVEIEISGYVDNVPIKNGAYTLKDFAGKRTSPVRNYLANKDVPFKEKEGGVTNKFSDNRRVQFSWIETNN